MANTKPPKWYRRLMKECPPRFHTIPDWTCKRTLTQYQRYCVIADMLGICLMPHQRLALAILSMPRCFELVLVIGRQQGKTVVVVIVIVDVLLRMAGHTAVYSAQKGLDAERKVRQEFKPLMWNAGMGDFGFSFNNGTADFGVHGLNEARLRTMSSDKNALRGETRVALGVIDEARADRDHTRSILITPATTVVAEAKLVTASTAGDVNSVYLNETQDKAREKYADQDSTICLLEYSIKGTDEYAEDEDQDTHDPADPALWRCVLPAIGYTVTVGAVQRAHEKMEPHDFAMEYLCKRLNMATDEAIPAAIWQALQFKQQKVRGALVLAIDSPPEQDRTAAVVCDSYGQVELIDVRIGPQTAYDWVTAKLERNKDISMVVMAKNNTLKRTGERLAMDGVRVKWYDTDGMHMAASRFWEAAHHDPPNISIRESPLMHSANRGAFRWQLRGGGWVFMRQEESDFVSPLIAATMAYDTAIRPGEYEGSAIDEDAIWDKALEEPDVWDKLAKDANTWD